MSAGYMTKSINSMYRVEYAKKVRWSRSFHRMLAVLDVVILGRGSKNFKMKLLNKYNLLVITSDQY